MEANDQKKPKRLAWLRSKHVCNMRVFGVLIMLAGLVMNYNPAFLVGLAIVFVSYQLSVNKWEAEWEEKEKEAERSEQEKP